MSNIVWMLLLTPLFIMMITINTYKQGRVTFKRKYFEMSVFFVLIYLGFSLFVYYHYRSFIFFFRQFPSLLSLSLRFFIVLSIFSSGKRSNKVIITLSLLFFLLLSLFSLHLFLLFLLLSLSFSFYFLYLNLLTSLPPSLTLLSFTLPSSFFLSP